jgi:hypothetical protein
MAENPLQTDDKLKKLLEDVNSVKSDDAFHNWRKSFLVVYESYLDPDGVLNARDADGRLIIKLQGLAKTAFQVKALCGDRSISLQQVTAEGRSGLTKLTTDMRDVEVAVGSFCPKTTKDQDAVGYDKFELGAVLIKDGFQAYEIMLTTRDFITKLRDGPLDGILDKNSLRIMEFYINGIQSFVDVMADLGLMGLMKKCMEVYKEKPRPKQKKPKSGKDPNDRRGEERSSDHGRGEDEPSKRTASDSGPKNGKGKSNVNFSGSRRPKKNEDEEFEGKAAEEEEEGPPPPPSEGPPGENHMLIYFDPKTLTLGTMPRDKCAAESELIVAKDDKGEEVLTGELEEEEEKVQIIWLLKKMERKKPKPTNWLDEIKKEKAAKKKIADKAANGGVSPKSAKPVKKTPRTKAAISDTWKTDLTSSTKSSGKKASSPKTAAARSKTPPKETSFRKVGGPTKKKSSEDYQGKYKKDATKPADDGWGKVSSHNKTSAK